MKKDVRFYRFKSSANTTPPKVTFKDLVFSSDFRASLWALFLVIGGLIIGGYFSHIEYLPDLDLASSLTILAAVSLASILLSLLFLLVFFLPSALWAMNIAEELNKKGYLSVKNKTPDLLGVIYWFTLPSILGLMSAAMIFFERPNMLVFSGIGLLSYAINFDQKNEHYIGLIKDFFFFLIGSLYTTLLTGLAVFATIIVALSSHALNSGHPWFIVILTIFMLTMMTISAASNHDKILIPFLITAFSVFALFLQTESFYKIPARVMSIYKLGNFKVNTLVLNADGCKLLNSSKLSKLLVSTSDSICTLDDVLILSRVGKEYYIKKREVRFIIKNEMVLSWTREEKETPNAGN